MWLRRGRETERSQGCSPVRRQNKWNRWNYNQRHNERSGDNFPEPELKKWPECAIRKRSLNWGISDIRCHYNIFELLGSGEKNPTSIQAEKNRLPTEVQKLGGLRESLNTIIWCWNICHFESKQLQPQYICPVDIFYMKITERYSRIFKVQDIGNVLFCKNCLRCLLANQEIKHY